MPEVDKKKLLIGGGLLVLVIVVVVIVMMSRPSAAPPATRKASVSTKTMMSSPAPTTPAAPAAPATGNLQVFWTSPKGQQQSGWLGVTGSGTNYTLFTHLVQSNGSVWQVDPATKVLFTVINGSKYAIDNSRWDLPPPAMLPYNSSNPSAFCILGRQEDVNTGEIFNAIMYNNNLGCLMQTGGANPQAYIYNCNGDKTQQSVLLNNQVLL